MDSRKIYYARVSSKDQNLARQIELFKSLGATDEQIITDKKSGKDFDREGYKSLKSAMGLRKGDTLVVKELDRLGRDKQAIKEELEYWRSKGVRVQVCDIPTTMQDFPEQQAWVQDMINNIIIEVYSTIAEQERLKEIQATIDSRAAKANEYDDTIVRQMIECIRVYHDGRLEIIFGGGYEIAEHL